MVMCLPSIAPVHMWTYTICEVHWMNTFHNTSITYAVWKIPNLLKLPAHSNPLHLTWWCLHILWLQGCPDGLTGFFQDGADRWSAHPEVDGERDLLVVEMYTYTSCVYTSICMYIYTICRSFMGVVWSSVWSLTKTCTNSMFLLYFVPVSHQ